MTRDEPASHRQTRTGQARAPEREPRRRPPHLRRRAASGGTAAILDVLRRFSARAIFFVVGSRVHRAPEMLARVVAEGHLLGNHSFAHPLGRQFGLQECRRDIDQCQAMIQSLVGFRPTLFRPPLGRLSLASTVAPRLAGLEPMLWSVDADDWRLRHPAEVPAAAERLLNQLSARPLHDIVLLHDERVLTAQLLEIVLPRLVQRNVNLRPALPFVATAGVG